MKKKLSNLESENLLLLEKYSTLLCLCEWSEDKFNEVLEEMRRNKDLRNRVEPLLGLIGISLPILKYAEFDCKNVNQIRTIANL